MKRIITTAPDVTHRSGALSAEAPTYSPGEQVRTGLSTRVLRPTVGGMSGKPVARGEQAWDAATGSPPVDGIALGGAATS